MFQVVFREPSCFLILRSPTMCEEEVSSPQLGGGLTRCKKHGGGSPLGSESEYDDSERHWIPMLLWIIAEIEKKGQDAVDIEMLEEANQFMRDSYRMPHPLHKENETDLGLWKARSETILHKNSTLLRVFECQMKKQFG